MTDVLLINPPMKSPKAQSDFNNLCPPLGLGYLAASLIEKGISVNILDLAWSSNIYNDLKDHFGKTPPPLVGITSVTQNYHNALQIARLVKSLHHHSFVVMGGHHVSYLWQEALEEKPIDAVVRFEGEETIVELYEQLQNQTPNWEHIKGMVIRQNGQHVETPIRPHQEQLDLIPYPARHLLPIERYTRPGTIMTSRGCPKKCIFCIASTFEGKYRTRSPENVVGELEMMRRLWGIKEYYFLDNVFTVDKQRVYAICDLIRKRLDDIYFHCVSRADLVTQDLVTCLKSAGCQRIEIGVESGVQRNIDAMEKSITLEQVKRAADLVVRAGLQPMFTLQIGSPYDTPESIQQTLDFATDLRAKGAITLFSIMTPYPGTPIYEKSEKYNISIRTRNWADYRTSNPVYDTAFATRNDFRRALYIESIRQKGHTNTVLGIIKWQGIRIKPIPMVFGTICT